MVALVAGMAATLIIIRATDRGEENANSEPRGVASAATPYKTPTSTGTPGVRPESSPPRTPAATPAPHGEHTEPPIEPVQATAHQYLDAFFDRAMTVTAWRSRLAALSTA